MKDNDYIDELIIKHFPFPEFNPGQYRAIKDSIVSILDNKSHTILSCPTGVGKSVIAMTIHKVIKDIKGPKNSVILTTTKGLQDQYNKDFNNLIDLKGKTNYSCLWNIKEGYNSPKCIEKVLSGSCSPDKCPYVHAKNSWLNRKDIKTTNSSLLISSPKIFKEDNPIEICVIDECHEIDKVIIHQSSIKFNIEDYPGTNKHFPDFKDIYFTFIEVMKLLFPNDREFVLKNEINKTEFNIQEFKDIVSNASNNIETSLLAQEKKDYKFVVIQRELLDLLDKINHFIRPEFDNVDWVKITDDAGSIEFVPIRSSGYMANNKLFYKAQQFLHMSATIGGIDVYCQNLGINKNEATYIEVDNPIPINQRQIYLKNLVKMNRFTDISDVINSIEPIIRSESGNGIIHTVSFKLAWDILKASPKDIKKRMLVSNNREEILSTLANNNDKIILSPSVETGYDFKNDLARWQIIAKVPFLNLGDIYTITRKNKSNNWYVREAVLRMIQSCGRIVRGLNDYGNTYIIDENVLTIISQYTFMFPEWWLNAVILED